MGFKQLSFYILLAVFMQGISISSINAGEVDANHKTPEVVFETNKGAFTLKLYADKAPKTVENFLRYVDKGFYDNTVFHRSIPGFVVQGGGFNKGMKQKKTDGPVKNESANRIKNSRGTISMARKSHPDTATSQFYINLAENSNLDFKSKYQPGYTVFGEVIKGMDTIDKISSIPTHDVDRFRNVPKDDVIVLSAKRKTVKMSQGTGKGSDLTEQVMQRYIAGEHYIVLDEPVPTRDKNKIEVVEMFSYGCPHCYEFEPKIKQWSKQQSSDIDFWFFPAVWNKSMNLYARAFYTAKELKVADKIHEPLFNAIVVKHRQLKNEEDIAGFFAEYGVDKKVFLETFKSETVVKQAELAESRVRNYKPAGVPEIVVNGKYRIGRMRAGGMEEMLAVADYLINKEIAMLNK